MKILKNLLLVLTIFALCFISCSKENSDNTKGKKIKIGLSLDDLRLERWQKDRDYFVEEAEKLGAEVIYVSSDGNATKQLADIENLIAQNIDVLVVIANDGNSLSPAIMQASQDGIPTLAYDRMINNCDIAHYITFDLEKVGRMQAEGVLDVTNKGRFYYLGGSPTDNNARFFRKGTMDALKPYIDRGDIELIGEQFTKDWLPDVALQIIEDMLTAQKNNVTAIVAANDAIGGAAIQALKAQGLAGKVPVSGQDADLAALQRIAKGEQAVTVYKPIKQIAVECAKAAVALAKGESVESNSSLNNGYKDVPTFYIEPIKVTKDNLDSTVIADGWVTKEDVYGN